MKNSSEVNVSIIIPVYNVEPYIETCLKSVIRQTYRGTMECVVVDDCGTDDSIAIVEQILASYVGDIRFTIVHHERNRELSAARNTGTAAATGEYVYYLDGDDEITEDCIEKMMAEAASDPAVEIVQGRYRRSDLKKPIPDVRDLQIAHATGNEEVRRIFYDKRQFVVSAWNKLIKRSFILQYGFQFKEGLLWEDGLWLFFILKYVTNVSFISDVTYLYRMRPGSIVSSTDKKTFAKHKAVFFYEILKNLTPGDEKSELKLIMKDKFAKHYMRFNRVLPEHEDVFSFLWEMAGEYRAYGLKARLAICKILGKTKYGWMVIPIGERLRHPRYILNDFRRLRGWIG